MSIHVPSVRQPFAPLDNPRLQHLASAKNRQNGNVAQAPSSGKANGSIRKSVLPSTKRPFIPSTFDDVDSENLDPTLFGSPSKKNKCNAFDAPVKPFNFTLSTAKSMPPPPTIPSRLSTPARANTSTPRTPLTAPAGRSPKRKIAGIGKSRRVSAPFTRIEPPFASRGSSSGALPFSLDAALSGTLPTPKPKKDAGATIQESMPSDWFFDIHEDTVEEEAATLMEHSTLTLDLSSDDESTKKEKNDMGKENVAPEGYDAPSASRALAMTDGTGVAVEETKRVKKTELVRKKIVLADDMDDGLRSPLSDLEAEPFFAEGLDKDAHVVVDLPEPVESAPATKLNVDELFVKPVAFTAGTKQSASKQNLLSTTDTLESKDEIVVWEDSDIVEPTAEEANIVTEKADSALKRKTMVEDENVAPVADEII